MKTIPNPTTRAHSLARKIRGAYSSYKAAFSVAYRLIMGKVNKTALLDAIYKAIETVQRLPSIAQTKLNGLQTAWLSIYNLDYLDL